MGLTSHLLMYVLTGCCFFTENLCGPIQTQHHFVSYQPDGGRVVQMTSDKRGEYHLERNTGNTEKETLVYFENNSQGEVFYVETKERTSFIDPSNSRERGKGTVPLKVEKDVNKMNLEEQVGAMIKILDDIPDAVVFAKR